MLVSVRRNRVWVQVGVELPMGYPCHALEPFDHLSSKLALKNLSSKSDEARPLVRLVLGSDATNILCPRDKPLEIVTGDPAVGSCIFLSCCIETGVPFCMASI
jgi:hypothetical protein